MRVTSALEEKSPDKQTKSFYEKENQLYEAHGQVELNRGDFSLKADHVQLNMVTKNLVAWGNVLLREGEDVNECQRLEVNLETLLGRIHQAKLFMKDQNLPEVAIAAREDLVETRSRLAELLQWMGESLTA